VPFSLRPSRLDDAQWIAELRAVVLRNDLERLGRFDPVRVRERFVTAFDATLTRIIVVEGADAGSIAVRPAEDGDWIEHFYLDPSLQGRGIGGSVLRSVLTGPGPFRLNVLQGSRARHLYERHGFASVAEDDVDVFMHRPR